MSQINIMDEEPLESEKEEEQILKSLSDLPSTSTETQISTTAKPTQPTELPPVPKLAELAPSKFKTNLERFHFYCQDLPSPNLFIDFDFYFMISSALARKVWIGAEGEGLRLFPNLYLICVADPGVGKSLPASMAHSLLDALVETRLDKKENKYYQFKLLNLGPDAITFEKLVLISHASTDVTKDINGKSYMHSSTSFCIADELGMLFHDQTKRVVYFLTKAWDCRNYKDDNIKRGEINIINICTNFLGCCTPDLIHELMKTRILDNGFSARVIFLYDNDKRKKTVKMQINKEQVLEAKHISRHLRKLATLPAQQLNYSPEALEWLTDWTNTQSDKIYNEHPKLRDYYSRKQAHLVKMAMNVHFAESLSPIIDVEDFIEAKRLLARAELNMHKAVCGTGDNPNFMVAKNILLYLKKHGPTSKLKLKIQFYEEADTDKLEQIFDFLVQTEQCFPTTLNQKAALTITKENV